MAFKFKKGTVVQQVMPTPIVGQVVDFTLDKESGAIMAKIEWKDAEHTHSRYFHEHELEEVKGK